MSAFEKVIPGAFLVCVALTACGDRTDRDGLAHNTTAGKVDTVTQPNNMPGPASAAPEAPKDLQGRDSAATAPLAPSDAKKENSTMPEALQGNNHSSPNVGSSGGKSPDTSSGLKKSSLVAPKTPKVIWV